MKRMIYWSVFVLCLSAICFSFVAPDWGFFGHRRINRMAVFTLPQDMLFFFKKEIEYVTAHAVDPDKRRYATKHEAVRHYIDIDHWGKFPFVEVPRDWTTTLIQFASINIVNDRNDTTAIYFRNWSDAFQDTTLIKSRLDSIQLSHAFLKRIESRYRPWFQRQVIARYYEEDWSIPCDSVQWLLDECGLKINCQSAFAVDHFSEYGILPYHLVSMQRRLTKAFAARDAKKILQLSSDFGHYIGDAHVPLHTTENYNGQMTDQVGIHAFWESRIPELLADETWDYFVGKASYIDDPQSYYWDIVLNSHSLLDSVLLIEKDLTKRFAEDQQFCYEERLERTIRTQCEAFAKAYDARMRGMVEEQMRGSIHAIGSAWYTAWIDAGQPDLQGMGEVEKVEEEKLERGESKGRKHEG